MEILSDAKALFVKGENPPTVACSIALERLITPGTQGGDFSG